MGNVKDNYYVMLHRQDAGAERPDVMVRRHLGAEGVDVEESLSMYVAKELATMARDGHVERFQRTLRNAAPDVCGKLSTHALNVYMVLFKELQLPWGY